MACDLAVCSTESTFSLPEPRRGLTAAGGGLLMRIMQMVPQKAAMELMLTCEPFSAQKALDCFLVNRVVEPDRVLDEAISLAKLICKGAPLAVECTKSEPPTKPWEKMWCILREAGKFSKRLSKSPKTAKTRLRVQRHLPKSVSQFGRAARSPNWLVGEGAPYGAPSFGQKRVNGVFRFPGIP